MIDKMVALLKKEQDGDDQKLVYCRWELDTTDDQKKALERSVSDSEAAIASAEDSIAAIKSEIEALSEGISALDKAVAEATENRKSEHEDFTELMAQDSAAKELLLFAKNRLNRFYNPKLYKAPPKRELSEGDQIYENEGGDIPTEAPGGIANTGISFVQVSARKEAPPPPPATAAAYTKKSGESNGVIAMIDLLVKDLDDCG